MFLAGAVLAPARSVINILSQCFRRKQPSDHAERCCDETVCCMRVMLVCPIRRLKINGSGCQCSFDYNPQSARQRVVEIKLSLCSPEIQYIRRRKKNEKADPKWSSAPVIPRDDAAEQDDS